MLLCIFVIIFQNLVTCIIFAVGLFSGGIASASDAAKIQTVLDSGIVNCENNNNDNFKEICDALQQLRICLAALAVSGFS